MSIHASPLQQELWHLDQHAGAGQTLNVPIAWRLSGPIDITALSVAIDALIARHECLRARFPSDDGLAMLDIATADTDCLQVEEIADSALLNEMLHRFCLEPFDLTSGPLTRARLFRIRPDEYVLAFNFHHIVMDAWSLELIESELGQLYRRATVGETLDQTAAYSLADVVAKLHADRYGTTWQDDIRFWTERLSQPPSVDLPPASQHKNEASPFAAGRIRRRLPAELADQLRDVSATDTTVFHALLAAYIGVIARLANTADVVVGVPIAARASAELSDVVMFATNVAPIRVDLTSDPSFTDAVRQVRTGIREALQHQSAPLSDILRHLKLQAGEDIATLAKIAATHRRHDGNALALEGVSAQRLVVDTDFSLYQLAMHVEQGADEIWIELEGRHLQESDLNMFWHRLEATLTAVATQPETRVSGWPILLAHEHRGAPAQAPSGGLPVPDAFLRTALSSAADTAIVDRGKHLTYWQLLKAAGAVADILQSSTMSTSDEVVAVCVRRGAAMLSAVLGIMLAGKTYLPVDPAWPPARIRSILDDAGVSRVLTVPATADHAGLAGRELLAAWPETTHIPVRPAQTTQSAYLLYTSGSTGGPKGVLFGYEALANLLEQMRFYTQTMAGKRVLASTTTTFDLSIVELLLPVVVGATCVIADDETIRDPALLAHLIAEERVDLVEATPTMWRALLEHLTVDIPVVIAAGEPMTDWLREQLLDRSGRCYNGYGPTETHYATMWQANRHAPVSIGQAIDGIVAWVLDRWDQPCADHTVGRLVLSGIGVGDGYLHRPELTAEKFRAGIPGLTSERAYETGDLASFGQDGLLYLHGRADNQIKLRGYRIELGEIESVVASVPGVSAAAAAPYSVGDDQRGLAVFIVASDGSDGNELPNLIRATVTDNLPDFMRPQLIRVITRLPLTSSGKTDRLELSRSITAMDVQIEPESTATSPIHLQLEELWRELLDLPRVPIRTSFFELGGDSIGAARLVARIKKRTDTRISLQDFLADPTIDGVSRLLAKASQQ